MILDDQELRRRLLVGGKRQTTRSSSPTVTEIASKEPAMTISIEEVEAGRIDLTDVVDLDAPPVGPIHPGLILRTEFLEPLGITSYRLAKATRVPVNRREFCT
jgi:hypothetical protein